MTLNVLGQDGPVVFPFVARLRRAVCPFGWVAGLVPFVSATSLGGVSLQQGFCTGRCSCRAVNSRCHGHRRFVSSLGTLSVFCVSVPPASCVRVTLGFAAPPRSLCHLGFQGGEAEP